MFRYWLSEILEWLLVATGILWLGCFLIYGRVDVARGVDRVRTRMESYGLVGKT